jgi:hypothetical protein
MASIDFFVVPTATFRVLFVFVVPREGVGMQTRFSVITGTFIHLLGPPSVTTGPILESVQNCSLL